MNNLLYYLLQVIVASGILYGYYHFVLRNKKFHRYNRFFLLAATIISILIPFLNIPVYFTNEEADSSFVLQTLRTISSTSFQETTVTALVTNPVKTNWFTWENIFYSFYILIASLAFIKIIFSLRKIRTIINRNLVEKIGNIHFVNTDEPGTPFSFFRWLFWNRKIELKSEKGEQVFRHELFHIHQKHSLDIVFTELLSVVFWINPFFHLIKKELKAIHEFLADEFAYKENDKWEYAELLLMQVLNTKIHLINPFFYNQIKRRIAMITSSQIPKYRYLRKLFVFPVAAIILILFAFSYRSKNIDKINSNSFEKPVVDTVPKTGDNKIFEKVEVEASFIGGEPAWRRFIEKNLTANIPAKNGAPSGTYTVWIKFIVDQEGKVSDVKALTNKGYGMEQEAVRVIKNGPDWIPPMQNGLKVKAYRLQPVTFIVVKNEKPSTDKLPLKKELIPENIKSDDNIVFEKFEKEPSFPGGEQGWRKYLERNLNVNTPVDSGANTGSYTVRVQFIVHKDGSISDLKALTQQGYGMEEEVLRVIKNGPNWVPAVQNGQKVTAYKIQSITFIVVDDEESSNPNFPPAAFVYLLRYDEGHKLKVNEVKSVTELKLYKAKSAADCEIISFRMTFDEDKGELKEFHNKGSKFNEALQKIINNIQSPTFFTIDDILVKTGNGTKKLVPKIYTAF